MLRRSFRFFCISPLAMPALSPSMEMGTLLKWNVTPGQKVPPGTTICSVQTDKAAVSFDNQLDEFYFGKAIAKEGDIVKVGGCIGLICEDEEELSKIDEYKLPEAPAAAPAAAPEPPKPAAPEPPKETAAPAPAAPAGKQALYGGSLEAAIQASGPAVMRIAAEVGADRLKDINPTGKGGRFSKSDVAMLEGTGPKRTEASSTSGGVAGGVAGVVVSRPGQVYNFKFSDTKTLAKLISTMPKAKKPVEKKALA